MNKQLHSLLLVLVSTITSGAHGMESAAPDTRNALMRELIQKVPTIEAQEQLADECLQAVSGNLCCSINTVHQEEKKDTPTILKPLSQAKKAELAKTMQMSAQDDSLAHLESAYHAALELEADMHPLERTKALVQERKNLWKQLKAKSQQTDDYLSGSEEEQDGDEVAQLSHVVARVHRRDGQVKTKTARLHMLTCQQAGLASEQEKRFAQLVQLQEKQQTLDTKVSELLRQKNNLLKQEAKIEVTQNTVKRLVKESVSFAQVEPFLAGVTAEQLVPTELCADLDARKKQHALQLGALVVAMKAANQELNPLITQVKELTKEQQKNLAAQAELKKSIDLVTRALSIAQTDKTKLLAALNEKVALTTQSKQKLEDEVTALRLEISEEKDDAKKRALRVELLAKERELLALAHTISHTKVARAQADGSYSYRKWLTGWYN